MRLLLDTNILISVLSNKNSISSEIKRIIKEADQVLVSTASIWEISIKKSIGKIKFKNNLRNSIVASGIDILDINAEHAEYIEKLPYIHKDPFDRMIISQAICENLKIVTTDKIFSKYGVDIIFESKRTKR
jgi:PIN domain nuclease of toxin-antitoxin system